MSKIFKVVVECVDELTDETLSRNIAKEYKIHKPSHVDEIGLNYSEQLSIIQIIMDLFITQQSTLISQYNCCPKCSEQIEKDGECKATIHVMGVDYKVKLQKYQCLHCGWSNGASLQELFGSDKMTDSTQCVGF